MKYRLVCNSCDLDWETDDWITAHERARDHELDRTSHWVSLHTQQ
jgi:hypothetical protein